MNRMLCIIGLVMACLRSGYGGDDACVREANNITGEETTCILKNCVEEKGGPVGRDVVLILDWSVYLTKSFVRYAQPARNFCDAFRVVREMRRGERRQIVFLLTVLNSGIEGLAENCDKDLLTEEVSWTRERKGSSGAPLVVVMGWGTKILGEDFRRIENALGMPKAIFRGRKPTLGGVLKQWMNLKAPGNQCYCKFERAKFPKGEDECFHLNIKARVFSDQCRPKSLCNFPNPPTEKLLVSIVETPTTMSSTESLAPSPTTITLSTVSTPTTTSLTEVPTTVPSIATRPSTTTCTSKRSTTTSQSSTQSSQTLITDEDRTLTASSVGTTVAENLSITSSEKPKKAGSTTFHGEKTTNPRTTLMGHYLEDTSILEEKKTDIGSEKLFVSSEKPKYGGGGSKKRIELWKTEEQPVSSGCASSTRPNVWLRTIHSDFGYLAVISISTAAIITSIMLSAKSTA